MDAVMHNLSEINEFPVKSMETVDFDLAFGFPEELDLFVGNAIMQHTTCSWSR